MNKLENKDIHFAHIHAMSHDGRGITTLGNKKTFVDGALSNETVAYQLIRKRSHYNEAKLIEVIHASNDRVTPPCPHFNLCGGCNLQHLDPDAQLKFKQQIVLDQLKHIGHVTPEQVMPPLSAHTIGYRRKARLG